MSDTTNFNTTHITTESHDDNILPINQAYLTRLLEAATRAAVYSALNHGVDMPIGAATGKDGKVLSAEYAQDNLLNDKDAHAERMAIRRTYEQFPGIHPDVIVVTFEPCNDCQDYLATLPGLKFVAYALPIGAALSRSLVRPKPENIVERNEHIQHPYQIIQIKDPELITVSELLLDATSRDLTTGKTTVSSDMLLEELPRSYLQFA